MAMAWQYIAIPLPCDGGGRALAWHRRATILPLYCHALAMAGHRSNHPRFQIKHTIKYILNTCGQSIARPTSVNVFSFSLFWSVLLVFMLWMFYVELGDGRVVYDEDVVVD